MTAYYLFRAEGDGWLLVNVYDNARDAAEVFVRCTGEDIDPEDLVSDLRHGNVFERENAAGDTYAVVSADSPLLDTINPRVSA